MSDKKARQFARYFLRGAMIPDVDRQGRILIPATLREAAGLEKEAVMIGVGNRIEIWDTERWDSFNLQTDSSAVSELLEEVGF